MAMFKAKFRKYWCDYCSEYTEIRTSSIDEILEYVYKTHKESVYPWASKFWCSGKSSKIMRPHSVIITHFLPLNSSCGKVG